MTDDVTTSWSRIRAWLGYNATGISERLQPGATDAQIQALESVLGMSVPGELRESLSTHNGGEGTGAFPSSDSLDMRAFSPMSAEQIPNAWTMLRDLAEAGEFAGQTTNPYDGPISTFEPRASKPDHRATVVGCTFAIP